MKVCFKVLGNENLKVPEDDLSSTREKKGKKRQRTDDHPDKINHKEER